MCSQVSLAPRRTDGQAGFDHPLTQTGTLWFRASLWPRSTPTSVGFRRAKGIAAPIPYCTGAQDVQAMPSLPFATTDFGKHSPSSGSGFASAGWPRKTCRRAARSIPMGLGTMTTRKSRANAGLGQISAPDVAGRPACLPVPAARPGPIANQQTVQRAARSVVDQTAALRTAVAVTVRPPAANSATKFKISQTTRPKGRVK